MRSHITIEFDIVHLKNLGRGVGTVDELRRLAEDAVHQTLAPKDALLSVRAEVVNAWIEHDSKAAVEPPSWNPDGTQP